MPNRLSNHAAFTLVEIMIVVSIIALLAALALPNFLRARKRSQASVILEEMRLIDGAKDTYAIEHHLAGTAPITWDQIRTHLKPSTRLYNSGGVDILGAAITQGAVDSAPKIADTTRDNFTDVVDTVQFWGSYAN
ncbi:MAG: type II secretion system GspH family protein [Verrucomicrobiota bacterium]|nr:type II secretion system GspH family protein [Verrucomicrobiota bacterium]